ncbi:MAG TPA: flagellar motor protein MotB [Bryobacteraceae bacterium]|nr:flagellar motor protein MotB [Bryobacteraceae bacterium]
MARAKKQAAHENHERWLVSYADFITLLFAFFVVMFASSQTDKSKAQQVSEAVKEALENGGVPTAFKEILGGTVNEKGKGNAQMKGPGGIQKAVTKLDHKPPQPQANELELLPSLQVLSRELEEEIKAGKIRVRLEPRGLVVSLQEAAFFPSGGDTLDPASLPSVEKVAAAIRDLPNPVRLEGHTDSVPIHTARFRNNWELSAARSITMLDVLTTKFEIPAERFAVAGYADTSPVASNDTEEGRARNRRVDIVILNRTMSGPDSGPKTGEVKSAEKSVSGSSAPGDSPSPAHQTHD